jgi:hypothetical protein
MDLDFFMQAEDRRLRLQDRSRINNKGGMLENSIFSAHKDSSPEYS